VAVAADGVDVAVAADGEGVVGRADDVAAGVELGRTDAVDDGLAVGPGVVCPPPQATAARTANARDSPRQTSTSDLLLISNLH
jgi:hypothetical protein